MLILPNAQMCLKLEHRREKVCDRNVDTVKTGMLFNKKIERHECRPNLFNKLYVSILLGDCNFFGKVNVLNGVQQFDAFVHWALEGFSSGDQTRSAAAFVDDCGADGICHVALAF